LLVERRTGAKCDPWHLVAVVESECRYGHAVQEVKMKLENRSPESSCYIYLAISIYEYSGLQSLGQRDDTGSSNAQNFLLQHRNENI
jgi:hypothetical protein